MVSFYLASFLASVSVVVIVPLRVCPPFKCHLVYLCKFPPLSPTSLVRRAAVPARSNATSEPLDAFTI